MRAVLNATFLSLLFTTLLVFTNVVISRTVNAAPQSCAEFSQETCAFEDYSQRQSSIQNYGARCLAEELKSGPRDPLAQTFEYDYRRYLKLLEKRLLPRETRVRKFYADVQKSLVDAVERSTSLSADKKSEYKKRILSTTLLLPSEHVEIGGSAEFRKTCGEKGLEENASFVVFGNGKTHVLLCPGRWVAALKNTEDCQQASDLDVESLLYTISHELGHSIGGNFAEFDSGSGRWKIKNDPLYGDFHRCMKGNFGGFPQADYGEATADYWASQAMANYLTDSGNARRVARQSLAGLCGTRLTSRHLPGKVRIENLILAQAPLQAAVGCRMAATQGCSL